LWALGGGRMAATQAIGGLSTEVSGPLAYGLALIATVGGAVSWYRNHHDAGALQTARWEFFLSVESHWGPLRFWASFQVWPER